MNGYIYENDIDLTEYEIKSALNIIEKKKNKLEYADIKLYLLKKGYKRDNIEEAFNNLENNED